jgi:hypothetical protein
MVLEAFDTLFNRKDFTAAERFWSPNYREIHHPGDIRLLRFNPPEPKREIGLAWRKTSPRKTDFVQFAQLLRDVAPRPDRGSFDRWDRRAQCPLVARSGSSFVLDRHLKLGDERTLNRYKAKSRGCLRAARHGGLLQLQATNAAGHGSGRAPYMLHCLRYVARRRRWAAA